MSEIYVLVVAAEKSVPGKVIETAEERAARMISR
jgi:hypothetical protein